jgi:hypothetical protein
VDSRLHRAHSLRNQCGSSHRRPAAVDGGYGDLNHAREDAMSKRWSEWTFRVLRAWVALAGAGVLSLAACSDGSGPGRMTWPPPAQPPPVVTPPAPAIPQVALGVIAFDSGGLTLTLRNGESTYFDETTTITLNGRAATFEALRRGRVALVRYEPRNTAPTHIDAYDLLVGPLESVDPATARLLVMGQRVVVTGLTAVGRSSVQDGALATLLPGSPVAVSGHVTATGEVLATRIDAVADDGWLLRGLVRSADAMNSRLTIGGVDVDFAQATWDSVDFPGGVPSVGDEVIVRAHGEFAGSRLVADAMEYVPRWFGATEGTSVRLDALITHRTSMQEFDVAGRTVRLACDIYTCEDMAEHLLENAEVRFTGQLTTGGSLAGSLVAVDFWSRSVSLTGPVSAIDPVTGAVTLFGFRIQPSELTNWIDDSGAAAPTMSANELRVGDTVDASGTYGGIPGLLLASSVRRVSESSPGIRGWQFVRNEPAIVMLGRPILTDATTKVDVCGAPADATRLFSMSVYEIEELKIELSILEPEPLRATRVTINDGNCW